MLAHSTPGIYYICYYASIAWAFWGYNVPTQFRSLLWNWIQAIRGLPKGSVTVVLSRRSNICTIWKYSVNRCESSSNCLTSPNIWKPPKQWIHHRLVMLNLHVYYYNSILETTLQSTVFSSVVFEANMSGLESCEGCLQFRRSVVILQSYFHKTTTFTLYLW